MAKWICCQIGAREHYAIPRALSADRRLKKFFTEAWVRPESPLRLLKPGLSQRFHPGLDSELVGAWNLSALSFEAKAKLRGLRGWQLVIERNGWFQQRALGCLCKLASKTALEAEKPILFAYSYAALQLFEFAREQGWRTVLGQIDGGHADQQLVSTLPSLGLGFGCRPSQAPDEYWESWRRECSLADRILVNSEWSRQLLVRGGIPDEKIVVVPLAYEPPAGSVSFARSYPAKFTKERPLRVLFLGQANARKGVNELLVSIEALEGEPVQFTIVGPVQITIPSQIRDRPDVRFEGAVSRADTARYYQDADVFAFPTHSDGFGLTQLEAQAWKLPVIASSYCGDVVMDGINGRRLSDASSNSITSALRQMLTEPALLQSWADNSKVDSRFSLESLGQALSNLF